MSQPILPQMNRAAIEAYWFDYENDRFVLLLNRGNEYVVAYARTLEDSEWYGGRYWSDRTLAQDFWTGLVQRYVAVA